MEYKKCLLEYKNKTIELNDLSVLLKKSMADTSALYEAVIELVESGLLAPVKKSGMNGNKKYPLYKKYRITAEPDISSDVIGQISSLHPILLKNGYLSSHPSVYADNVVIIDKLSQFFFQRKSNVPVSRKERSFEIFEQEKILDDSSIKSLIKSLGITQDDLCFYDTPEYCFHDYIPEKKNNMVLLICENKDIWFNIRRCMFEDNYKSLFGTHIDGVVYGNGNKVSQKKGALIEYVRFMGSSNVRFLYWGDIDREGFDIFRRTKAVNPSLDISLFIPGYRKMIERARHIQLEESPSSKKEGMRFDDLIELFTPEEKIFLNTVFTENKLVPQEIIPYTLLSEE